MINTTTITITPDLLIAIAELDEFKGAWRSLGALAPDRMAILQRTALAESVGSSIRLGGKSLSDRDVDAILAQPDHAALPSIGQQQAAGYVAVIATILAGWRDLVITEELIFQLHRDMVAFTEEEADHAGSYLQPVQNLASQAQADGEQAPLRNKTASIPKRMKALIKWLHKTTADHKLHPLLVVAVFVAAFLEIRPFKSGNRRLSLALTTLLLLQSGYTFAGYDSIERAIEHDPVGYSRALRQTMNTIYMPEPDWQPWLRFFFEAMHRQRQSITVRIEHERLLLTSIPDAAMQIIEYAAANGRINISQAVEHTGANRNTIKDYLKMLVSRRLLSKHSAARGTWYSLT